LTHPLYPFTHPLYHFTPPFYHFTQVEDLVSVHSNYVMMAYGITGAGKTFTLEGPPSNPGVMPRALEHLFDLLDADPQRAHLKVCISYYEIYNEHIYDLLMPSDGNESRERASPSITHAHVIMQHLLVCTSS
jgi:hypothetical protein